jgi:hypothetical protein
MHRLGGVMNSGDDRLVNLQALHQPSFEVPKIVYRRAVATWHRAQRMAAEYEETNRTERRLREIDAVLETVVLTQAACEGWIYFAYRHTKAEPEKGGGWIQRWIDAPRLICDPCRPAGQPPTRGLDQVTIDALRRLSAWRNFLLHGDDRARQKLGDLIDQEPDVRLLTAALAEQVIAWADHAFTDLGSLLGVHGVIGLNSAYLWIGYDE